MDNCVISFGPFRVTRSRRLLERNGEPVHIGSRAFDVLSQLLEHHGQIVSHKALMAAVWPRTTVSEGNLRYQMTVLRKALGDGETKYCRITNVPGRGYCFTAPISQGEETSLPPKLAGLAVTRPNPIPPPVPLIRREDTIGEIKNRVVCHRIFSVIATDSKGKTSVAVARQIVLAFCDEGCFVDIGLVDDPSRIADALAVPSGFRVRNADPLNDVVTFLRRRMTMTKAVKRHRRNPALASKPPTDI